MEEITPEQVKWLASQPKDGCHHHWGVMVRILAGSNTPAYRYAARLLYADALFRKVEAKEAAEAEDEEVQLEDPEATAEREAREYAEHWAKTRSAMAVEVERFERAIGTPLTTVAGPNPPAFLGGQSAGAALGHLIPVDAYISKSLRPDCRPDMLYRATLPGGHAAWRGTIEEAREAILGHLRKANHD